MLLAALDPTQVAALLLAGVIAGLMGGMLGVGGGIVMIPAMLFVLGEHRFGTNSLHLYKLAAIAASLVVSLPAAARHLRARAVVVRMVPAMLTFAAVGVIAGTLLAATFVGDLTHLLRRIFGGFLVAVVLYNVYEARRSPTSESFSNATCPMPSRFTRIGLIVGLPAGFVAGLLGIGGGVWAVPAQRYLLGTRLRNAIATSSLMIVGVAAMTALTLTISISRMPTNGLNPLHGWLLAAVLAPGALIGGWLGADLTHRLPLRWVRLAFQVALGLSGLRLLLA
ncbi:MAG: sulfite exporter TauE/SafE family protein [Phycisphaerales bacterium]|nr:sulfite exporter TauE/SafE family protein [Phycisphaerales bacterium]